MLGWWHARRTRHRRVGLEAVEAGCAGGGDAEGRLECLAEDFRLRRTLRDIDHGVRPEADAFEDLAIVIEREVVFGAAVEKIPGNLRHAAARDGAQLFDIQCLAVSHRGALTGISFSVRRAEDIFLPAP